MGRKIIVDLPSVRISIPDLVKEGKFHIHIILYCMQYVKLLKTKKGGRQGQFLSHVNVGVSLSQENEQNNN